MWRGKFLNFIITILGIILIANLVRSIAGLWQKGEIIKDYEKRLWDAQGRNEEIKKNLAKLQSPEYIEKQAREKLNLGKEKEFVVILPAVTPLPKSPVEEALPPWRQWFRLFF